jgi:hypothetical protein
VPSPNPHFLSALPGISGILVTPFDQDDRIAPQRLKSVIDRAIGAGVHILTANGNTGEFYSLTTAEAEQMVHAVAEQIDGRAPLLAGVGRSIGDAVALARASRAVGAAALMVHQPPRSLRRAARRGRLCAAHCGRRPGAADRALPEQRRHRAGWQSTRHWKPGITEARTH